jgi:hypothetical protein
MAEPSRRASRLSIAAAILAVLGVGGVGFVLGQSNVEPTSTRPSPPTPTPTAASPPAPVLPAVQPPLSRAELLTAVSSAADAFASGRPLPDAVAALVGREFELNLPFGCPGALQSSGSGLSAEYDESAEALRVRAEPVRWTPETWLPAADNNGEEAATVETIEGFWISRPWTSSEACPRQTAEDAQRPPAEQTLAIAQFFTPEGSRVGRRDGKPYEAVEKIAPQVLDTRQGLRLRLRGKLARVPGGSGPILCRSANGMRPICILSAAFDQVAIVNPATGATLATWDVSSQNREPAD